MVFNKYIKVGGPSILYIPASTGVKSYICVSLFHNTLPKKEVVPSLSNPKHVL